jgi:uncharacterized protein involved in type VI secretion and phage assembly
MPQETQQWVAQVDIKVNGRQLSRELIDAMVDVVVDTTLHLPAMFALRFHDEALEILDGGPFDLGKPIEIELPSADGPMIQVFKGEITGLEPAYNENAMIMLTVRGYDKTHRLNRGTTSRAFVQTYDSDIVTQVCREAGLQVEVEQTTQQHDHVFQHNQTDLEFLQERARRSGYELLYDGTKMYFRKPRGSRGELDLAWGEGLRSFYPRLTLTRQVDEVTVKSWDPVNKQEITGKSTRSEIAPEIGIGSNGGGPLAKSAFSAAKQVVVRQPVDSQPEADALAQAVLDEINAGFVEAEGVAFGNGALVAGKLLNISRLGNKFSGKYMVTAATHVYSQDGYEVHFRVEGARARLMADLIEEQQVSERSAESWGGVVSAIVTNNTDPDKMGRVKLKFPWLDGQLESDWARVASVGAGNQRGLFWMPEVNDEVLVAFEHGDFDHPYVVGCLWNGQDKPPENPDNALKNGKVEIRMLKTREGHIIRLVDDSAGKLIEIIDCDNINHIKLDVKNKKLQITTTGDMEIKSTGKTNIQATGTLTVKGDANINVEAGGNLALKATGNASVEASGQLNLKGTMVNIN